MCHGEKPGPVRHLLWTLREWRWRHIVAQRTRRARFGVCRWEGAQWGPRCHEVASQLAPRACSETVELAAVTTHCALCERRVAIARTSSDSEGLTRVLARLDSVVETGRPCEPGPWWRPWLSSPRRPRAMRAPRPSWRRGRSGCCCGLSMRRFAESSRPGLGRLSAVSWRPQSGCVRRRDACAGMSTTTRDATVGRRALT
jgi:hypothetical protein